MPSLFVTLVVVLVVLPAFLLLLLVKLPKPMPYRWDVRYFLLMGMPADQFLSLILKNGIDPVFYHRALYATYISLMGTFFWIPKEEEKYPVEVIERVPIAYPPIFILGHYRSGTSLLHEMLHKDERLLAPTAFQCYVPRIFLGREKFMEGKFSALKMERPMDSMKVGLASPFEDEFAVANLSGVSPYMGAIFPRQYHYYERYLALKDVTQEELSAWKKSITFFFKKILFRRQDKRLILKV
ncbi:sulfotransferase family protein [Nannochloropsis oceanica]